MPTYIANDSITSVNRIQIKLLLKYYYTGKVAGPCFIDEPSIEVVLIEATFHLLIFVRYIIFLANHCYENLKNCFLMWLPLQPNFNTEDLV